MNSTGENAPIDLGEIRAVWAVHLVINLSGLFLSTLLIYSARKSPVKTSADAITAAVCSICACLSAICGIRNAASIANGRFGGGAAMCQIESFVLVIGMTALFQIVGLTSVRTVAIMQREKAVPIIVATLIMFIMLLIAVIGTLVFGSLSGAAVEVGLGTYCFFGFTSLIIRAWIMPMFFATIVVLSSCYTWVTIVAARARNRIRIVRTGISSIPLAAYDSSTMLIVVQRQTWVVFLLILAWVWVVVLFVAETSGHPLSDTSVMILGGFVPMSNILVPIAYAALNPYQRKTLVRFLKCHLCGRSPVGGKCIWLVGRSEISEELSPPVPANQDRPLGSPRVSKYERSRQSQQSRQSRRQSPRISTVVELSSVPRPGARSSIRIQSPILNPFFLRGGRTTQEQPSSQLASPTELLSPFGSMSDTGGSTPTTDLVSDAE